MAYSHANYWFHTEAAARKLGVTLQPLEVRGPEDFEAAFAAASKATLVLNRQYGSFTPKSGSLRLVTDGGEGPRGDLSRCSKSLATR